MKAKTKSKIRRKHMKPKKNTKKSGLFSKLASLSSPGKRMVVFVLVFGVIGSFFLIRSFAATPSGNSNCAKSGYCYYPVDPKVAFWQNGLRQQYNANPQYVGLNDCLSSYARTWAARMASLQTLKHSNTERNWSGEISKCGNWTWLGENIWKGPCGDTNIESKANDCSWNAVDGPVNSFLHDGQNPNIHLANILHSPMNAQGVGSFYDSHGIMWIVAEYANFQ